RPTSLSVVDGLSILPYSNCPHYADSTRKSMYHQLIQNRKMKDGYGMDDLSGILFKNGKLIETVTLNDINHSYYVNLKNGNIHSEKLKSRILIDKNAIPEKSYTKQRVEKFVKDFSEIDIQNNPLNAYVFVQYLNANGKGSQYKLKASKSLQERIKNMEDSPINENRRNSILNTKINEALIYDDLIAGIITKYPDFYGIWWFYKENGKWMSAGEDVGGETLLETEIIFRETIKKHLKNVQE
ncbi:MAG: Type 1 glutamine amidotransferase-like domain-containing protein, partial [Tannerellaceae bacterium]|nr:Type 1 glutamine amidotransferase-like domain-containing protein [Tannerellaceae bacterium]